MVDTIYIAVVIFLVKVYFVSIWDVFIYVFVSIFYSRVCICTLYIEFMHINSYVLMTQK